MKTIRRLTILASVAVVMLVLDMVPPPAWLPFDVQLMSTDAHAVAGRQRRTRRRGAAAGYQAGQASASAQQQQAASGEQATTEQRQAATEQPQAAPAQPTPAPAPAPSGALPEGTVVKDPPEGCTKQVVNGVEYQFDGTNYYRAAFQGSELVYVTTNP